MSAYRIYWLLNGQEKDIGIADAPDKQEAEALIRNTCKVPKEWVLKVEEVKDES